MARPSEEIFERNVFHFRVWAGLGQDLLRSLTLNGEVDRESHLFLSSGPPLAKAWDENLGAKVGGSGYGGALLGPLTAKVDKKILALTSLLFLRIFISRFRKYLFKACWYQLTSNSNNSGSHELFL